MVIVLTPSHIPKDDCDFEGIFNFSLSHIPTFRVLMLIADMRKGLRTVPKYPRVESTLCSYGLIVDKRCWYIYPRIDLNLSDTPELLTMRCDNDIKVAVCYPLYCV